VRSAKWAATTTGTHPKRPALNLAVAPTRPRTVPVSDRFGAQSLMQAVALLASAFQWLRTQAQQ